MSSIRKGFFVDLDRCVKCHACEIACRIWNGINVPSYRTIIEIENGAYPFVERTNVSIACMHCEEAYCMAACPAKAIYKREDGVVLVDSEKCVGCRLCSWVCPFGAPKYGPDLKMQKCTFCNDRPDWMPRACEEACPTGAIVTGTIDYLEKVIKERKAKRIISQIRGRRALLYILP
ncbi:MAG: 4Fe-4S dicluster domain-containing protein [Candidatus Bathyarchaeia archaeon]